MYKLISFCVVIALSGFLMSGCAQTTNKTDSSSVPRKGNYAATHVPGYHERGGTRANKNFSVGIVTNMTSEVKFKTKGDPNVKSCKDFARLRYPQTDMLASCNLALSNANLIPRNRVVSLYHRGILHQNLDNLALARLDYTAALKLNPQFADAMLALAGLDFIDAHFDRVLETTQAALQLQPENPAYGHYLQGYAYEKQMQFQKARLSYQQALAIKPKWRAVRERKALIDRNWPSKSEDR